MEQKNWARVRELVGYHRYDTAAELAKLNVIWALDATFTNYFLPQQKLAFKQRSGAKAPRDTTPHQRALAHKDLGQRLVIAMNAAFRQVKPAALSLQILALTGALRTQAAVRPPRE